MMDFHVVPLDDDRDAIVITETEQSFDLPICDICGAVIGDDALHAIWHETLR